MHVHLDVVGGISGDIFCAALLDAFPELLEPLTDFIHGLPFLTHYRISCVSAKQKEISGKRFLVLKDNAVFDDKNHIVFTPLAMPEGTPLFQQQSHHLHHSWPTIEAKILRIADGEIRDAVLNLYRTLVIAESDVHGIDVQNVHLHEVGSDDALVDMVSAAFLTLRCPARSWSFSSLPWGSGQIKCAHGVLPVPAPATVKILRNFTWRQDSETGERITPTGAAILAWLAQWQQLGPHGTLIADGYGCGTYHFARTPNILRVCLFAPPVSTRASSDIVEVVQFDIDDMSPEMLALAQQRLRERSGVIDLTSQAVSGKKGRVMIRTELLCQPGSLEDISQAVFRQTSTLGIRHWQAGRNKLLREQFDITYQQESWPVKVAFRPDGISAKLEADALGTLSGDYQQLVEMKFRIEQSAIKDK